MLVFFKEFSVPKYSKREYGVMGCFFRERTQVQYRPKMCKLTQHCGGIWGKALFHLCRPKCFFQNLVRNSEVNKVTSWSYCPILLFTIIDFTTTFQHWAAFGHYALCRRGMCYSQFEKQKHKTFGSPCRWLECVFALAYMCFDWKDLQTYFYVPLKVHRTNMYWSRQYRDYLPLAWRKRGSRTWWCMKPQDESEERI